MINDYGLWNVLLENISVFKCRDLDWEIKQSQMSDTASGKVGGQIDQG